MSNAEDALFHSRYAAQGFFSTDPLYEQAVAKHEMFSRLETDMPGLMRDVRAGQAPVIRIQCPNRHHLGKVALGIEDGEWQLVQLDPTETNFSVSAVPPGGRPGVRCRHREDDGTMCGAPIVSNLMGQATCEAHGAKAYGLFDAWRVRLLCKKCSKGGGGRNFVLRGDKLLRLYVYAVAAGVSRVTVDHIGA